MFTLNKIQRKKDLTQINNLNLHLEELEKEVKAKSSEERE